ncbi:MAG: hypothetical protein ACK50P_17485 [Planctomycetaceae bacterium]|jgi:hypothetical protein
MDAMLIRVADAVVQVLQTGSFRWPFSVERCYVPRHTPQQLKSPLVSVVPAGWSSELASRHTLRRDCTIHVGLQQKLVDESNTEIDALVSLAQAFEEHLRQLIRLPTIDATLLSVEALAVPLDSEDLDQRRVFTTVLSLTYRILE